MERKIQALLCHKSQLGPEVGEMIRKWDAETGKPHGYSFAEGFKVMNLKEETQPETVAAETAVVQEA
jgi:hypothetical protein